MRCGLHPWERFPESPNRLLVSVEMFAAWPLSSPDAYIDYDRVRSRIVSWRDRPHVDLLETLLEELLAFVFEDAAVESARVSVSKPDIFPEAAGAGVELHRRRPAAG